MKKLLILVAMFAQFSNAQSYTCDNSEHGVLNHVEDMEVTINPVTHRMTMNSDNGNRFFTATKTSDNTWSMDANSDVIVKADSYGMYTFSKNGKTWLTCYETDFN